MALSLDDTPDPAATPEPSVAASAEPAASPPLSLDMGEPALDADAEPVVEPILRDTTAAEAQGGEAAPASTEVAENPLDTLFGKPEAPPQAPSREYAALEQRFARLEALFTQQQQATQRAAPQPTDARQNPTSAAPEAAQWSDQQIRAAALQHAGTRPPFESPPELLDDWEARRDNALLHYSGIRNEARANAAVTSQYDQRVDALVGPLMAYRAEAKAIGLAPQGSDDDYVAMLANRIYQEDRAATERGRGLAPSDLRRVAQAFERDQMMQDRVVFDRRMKADPVFARHMAAYAKEKQALRPRLAGAAAGAAATPPSQAASASSTRAPPVSRSRLGSAESIREADRILDDFRRTRGRGARA